MCRHNPLQIDPTELIIRLEQFQADANDDMARVIELLLLENHALALGQSNGFRRGVSLDFSNFPRFLKIVGVDESENDTSDEEDLAQ